MKPLLILLGLFLTARVRATLAVPFPLLMGEAEGRREVAWDAYIAPLDEVR